MYKKRVIFFIALLFLETALIANTKEEIMIEMDKQSQLLLDQINAQQIPSVWMQSIETLRNSATFKGYQTDVSIGNVEDVIIPVSGSAISLRIYTPLGDGQFPVVVFYHGGGWVAGDLNYSDAFCREICSRASTIVISVDYRLAPENKFPIPLQDCYTATLWTVQNIQKYKGNPKRLAICGASSGGNLAAAVALMVRDNKSLSIQHQILIYPVLDTNFETNSYEQFGVGYRLTKKNMQWYWQQYLRSDDDEKIFYAAPLKATDLSNLPATLIITAYFDPLRDDGVLYAKRLKDEGVPTVYSTYYSIHPFVQFANQLEIGKKAIIDISEYIKNSL